MKPDGALADEMDDNDIDPGELFCQLGLMVAEGRVPEASVKGRTEGPHCPTRLGDSPRHVCSQTQFVCQRKQMLLHEMNLLFRNRIPMCIEVLLCPDCDHGRSRCRTLDVTVPPGRGYVLLERWTIQLYPRRWPESIGSVRVLLQAVQSYLYFSQLSAWLNLTHGKAPANVAYRISPPGEFCTSTFQSDPVWHTFPVCSTSKQMSFKVTVGTLPRSQLIKVPCSICSTEPSQAICATSKPPMSFSDEFSDSEVEVFEVLPTCRAEAARAQSRRLPHNKGAKTSPPPYRDKARSDQSCSTSVFSPVSDELCSSMHKSSYADSPASFKHTRTPCIREGAAPPKDLSPPPPTTSSVDSTGHLVPGNNNMGAIPKRKMLAKSPQAQPTTLCKKPPSSVPVSHYLKEGANTTSNNNFDSPKVILSQKQEEQVYYCRDSPPRWPLRDLDLSDSDHSSPEVDRFLKTLANKQTCKLEPLTPEEMQNYLADLSRPRRHKSEKHRKTFQEKTGYADSKHAKAEQTQTSPAAAVQPSPISYSSALLAAKFSDLQISPLSCSPTSSLTCSPPPQTRSSNNNNNSESRSVTQPKKDVHNNSHIQNGAASCSVTNGSSDKVEFSIGEGEDSLSPNYNVNNHDSDHTNGVAPPRSLSLVAQLTKSPQAPRGKAGRGHIGMSSRSPHKPARSPTDAQIPASGFCGFNKASPLFRTLIRRELSQQFDDSIQDEDEPELLDSQGRPVPSAGERAQMHRSISCGAKMVFNTHTGLPMQSSPAPIKKKTSSGSFDFDDSLTNIRAIKNSLSCANLDNADANGNQSESDSKTYSISAPASTTSQNCLLGNFEESLLNGRIEPVGVVDGFTVSIGASGAFCPKHLTLPVTAFFFSLSDDNAPSPYLGHVNLEPIGRRGYQVPQHGTVQVTLFNPNKTVVKMFVVMYDLTDMPANCQTFLRQRTVYMPVKGSPSDTEDSPVYLRYLIHLRFASSKSGKIYLHTDIRLIFARDKFEYDSRVANYELRSFTEGPTNPKFSPKR